MNFVNSLLKFQNYVHLTIALNIIQFYQKFKIMNAIVFLRDNQCFNFVIINHFFTQNCLLGHFLFDYLKILIFNRYFF